MHYLSYNIYSDVILNHFVIPADTLYCFCWMSLRLHLHWVFSNEIFMIICANTLSNKYQCLTKMTVAWKIRK